MVHFRTLIDNHEHVTVAVVGPVSSGKTSFLSMILNKLVGTIAKQRATMTTTVFRGTDAYDSATYAEQVAKVQRMDKELRDNVKAVAVAVAGDDAGEDAEIADDDSDDEHAALKANLANAMQTNIVDIPRLDLFNKLHATTKIQLVDIPGLNDSSTKELYFNHLEDIFQHLSVIVLIFDINGAMNTADEMQILLKVVELAKQVHDSTGLVQKLFVVANKCDEMTYDATSKQLKFNDAEDEQLYQQLVSRVDSVVAKTYPGLSCDTVRISAENSFIYNKCLSHVNTNQSAHFGFLTDSQTDTDANADAKRLASQYEKKYKDKLGAAEHGKKWHRLNATEQDAYLKDTLTPENIAKSLQESGYETFRNQLVEHLTAEQQCTYLLNNLQVCVKTLVAAADPTAVFECLSIPPSQSHWLTHSVLTNLLEVCEKYESIVSNFKQDAPAVLDTFSFGKLMKPFFENIADEMAGDITCLESFDDTVVTADGQVPDTTRTHEKTLTNVLANLRTLVASANDRRVLAGNDVREDGGDVLGVSSLVVRVEAVLLAYYKAVAGCKTVAHAVVHDIVSTKIPGVSRTTMTRPLVLQLFANETLCGLPKTLGRLLDLSKTVVSYCKHYHENGILTEAQRNKCLSDFILDMYQRAATDPNGTPAAWATYLHSAKHMVWDYVLAHNSVVDYSVVRERYETFGEHSRLCEENIRMSTNRYVSEHVSPLDTMEYVCAEWHYPAVFADEFADAVEMDEADVDAEPDSVSAKWGFFPDSAAEKTTSTKPGKKRTAPAASAPSGVDGERRSKRNK